VDEAGNLEGAREFKKHFLLGYTVDPVALVDLTDRQRRPELR
jgi:hypothetical protein